MSSEYHSPNNHLINRENIGDSGLAEALQNIIEQMTNDELRAHRTSIDEEITRRNNKERLSRSTVATIIDLVSCHKTDPVK